MSAKQSPEKRWNVAQQLIMGFLQGRIGSTKMKSVKVKSHVQVGNRIKVCPGGHHAWFESNIGPVRKPL